MWTEWTEWTKWTPKLGIVGPIPIRSHRAISIQRYMLRALDDIRILDLSRMLPGPYCSMMLADLGADVIKVEDTRTGDPTRHSAPKVGHESSTFLQVNRNKRSVSLDLKAADGRELFLKLAATADVILEQFRPGVVERLGIGYNAVERVNTGIVYCSLSGYGQDGPFRDRAGHDINYIALAGALGLTADSGGRPVIPGVQIADLAGGMIAALAILAALLARERTGRGQFIDVSMFDVVLSMLPVPAAHQVAGIDVPIGGKYVLSGAYPFYNVYETGDARFMTLGALEPKFWENFCRKVGRTDLIARQFDRGVEREQLFEEVRAIFKERTQAEWIELMRDADACCEPVLSMSEAFEHAQTCAREMILNVAGNKSLGFGYKLSDTPAEIRWRAPRLGEHTDELLAEIGISNSERKRLLEAGIIRAAEGPG